MTTTTALVSMAPADVDARIRYAKTLSVSEMLPAHYIGRPGNVLVAVETGLSLGIEPIHAIRGIIVIKGRATMTADLMGAIIRRAGHKLRIVENAQQMRVTATLIRHDDPDFEFTATWDIEKARQAGLWGSQGPWQQYPLQMMRARAISEVARMGASDALFGMIYTPEEAGAIVDEDGAVIEAEPHPAPTPSGPVPSGRVDAATLTGAAPLTQDTEAALADLANQLDAGTVAKGLAWASGGQARTLGELTEPQGQALLPELRKKAARAQAEAGRQYVDAEIITDPTTGEVHD